MTTLDNYDWKILNLLQQNGRLTNQELSQIIGLSTSQCSRRRIALEQNGYIEGYQARLALKAQKRQVQGLVEITLNHHDPETMERFHHQINANPAVLDAYKVTGEYDYQLKVGAYDLNGLNTLLNELASYTEVSQIKTSVILDRLKENQIVLHREQLESSDDMHV
ncbi:Lrp/AsnC family transcriptional regulator [Celerinatantimonas diazotrophica]|uniref:DNA-binding Lrp family transcriptional regulator n=1 Tax=Celerinatantimonas diazotrophica TaxID=412034 RepID=A0A4V2PNJ1_9GAMM|nr:Lrp/AsnC family transcriptional regulator [Celerinatantimonas diazotrophica]TCK47231.1 DNA-binding Lrp family transcriptional regulator [Celerinatantimonas diazotrophica]CAG9296003.1 Leucine-responsive regulatory protein [Celerinatantimonas diazotrophica]